MRASPGRLAGRRGRSDQVDLTCPDLLPSSLPIANVGALTELPVLAREQCNDWLGQQRVVMSSYRRGQRRGQARAAPARRRRPGAALPLAISLPALLAANMIEETRWPVRRPETAVAPPAEGTTWARPAVSRILQDCYPTGAYWRVTGASTSTSRTGIGGLPPSAAWNASRLGRSRHREIATTASGSSSTVHVCAPKQPSAAAARSWVSAHRASSSSRRPGAGRNVVTWIRPACSAIETPFLRHPRQPPALLRFRAAAVP